MKWQKKWKLQAIVLLGIFSLVTILALSRSGLLVSNTKPEFISSAAPTGSSLAFEHIVVDPSPPSGLDCCLDVLAIGDLDGDKKPDIMVGSQDSIGAVWYQNPSLETTTSLAVVNLQPMVKLPM